MSFIDTTQTDFGQGTLHLTNITGSSNNANVTLNFTTSHSDARTIPVYNYSGNFTSRVWDTGTLTTNISSISWEINLPNSSDIVAISVHDQGNQVGAFYKNGSLAA